MFPVHTLALLAATIAVIKSVAADDTPSRTYLPVLFFDQVLMAIKQIRDIIAKDTATYAYGYHFLAHSQGVVPLPVVLLKRWTITTFTRSSV